jgi:hypothetical protein
MIALTMGFVKMELVYVYQALEEMHVKSKPVSIAVLIMGLVITEYVNVMTGLQETTVV